MALSFAEKRTLQKRALELLAQLRSGTLSFKEKRVAQKEILDILAKLRGDAVTPQEKSMLDRLNAGEFNGQAWTEFLNTLEDVLKEQDGDLETVKPGATEWLKAHSGDILTFDDEGEAA